MKTKKFLTLALLLCLLLPAVCACADSSGGKDADTPAETPGNADPSAAVFLPYERLAADASRSLAPGLCMTEFREAKRE